jgi:hypothetical protein
MVNLPALTATKPGVRRLALRTSFELCLPVGVSSPAGQAQQSGSARSSTVRTGEPDSMPLGGEAMGRSWGCQNGAV